MTAFDTQSLLQPVAVDRPAGDDLEYDPQFLALNEAATGTPERRMGDTVVPAEEPDWRRVLNLGTDLLRRSKDLRAAVRVARALLGLQGLPGLHAGLDLVSGLLAGFWDGLYPNLDADDDNDPTARINALLELTDRDTLLAQLRTTPLIRSRAFGAVSWREIEIAEGRAQPVPGVPALDAAAVSGAFQDCAPEDLAAAVAAAAGALSALDAINATLAEHLRSTQLPSMDSLVESLRHVHTYLQRQLGVRQPGAEASGPDAPTAAGGSAEAAPGRPAAAGVIGSREDVVRTLGVICDWYARHEPSSPVPLLLKRAQRLVTADFIDIVRDLAPDALSQIEKLMGTESQS